MAVDKRTRGNGAPTLQTAMLSRAAPSGEGIRVALFIAAPNLRAVD